jgi:hypothetical protein
MGTRKGSPLRSRTRCRGLKWVSLRHRPLGTPFTAHEKCFISWGRGERLSWLTIDSTRAADSGRVNADIRMIWPGSILFPKYWSPEGSESTRKPASVAETMSPGLLKGGSLDLHTWMGRLQISSLMGYYFPAPSSRKRLISERSPHLDQIPCHCGFPCMLCQAPKGVSCCSP